MLRRDLAKMESRRQEIPSLRSVARITKLPVVETGLHYASSLYTKVKQRSWPAVRRGLSTTEGAVQGALHRVVGVALVFENQIHLVDAVVCKGMDVVEEGLQAVALAPVKVLVLTKGLVDGVVVRPVLRRADSVLSSKLTSLTAEKIDTVIDIADKYVDQYLPNSTSDTGGPDDCGQLDGHQPVVVHTMRHVNRFSRKLQRRLTQRTLAEAKALSHLSQELLLALLHLAKLAATDPKAVRDKAVLLWAELSEDEPENQARPASLEGLVAMVAREATRRGVHLVNLASVSLAALPSHLAAGAALLADYIAVMADMLLQTWNLDKPKDQAVAQVRDQVVKFQHIVDQINSYITHVLVKTKGQILVPCPLGESLDKRQERCAVKVHYGCTVRCWVVLTVDLSSAHRAIVGAENSGRKVSANGRCDGVGKQERYVNNANTAANNLNSVD